MLANQSLGRTAHWQASRGLQCRSRVACQSVAPADAATRARVLSVPERPEQQVNLAATAVESAWRAGNKRQRIEMMLPLIGATDLDDWPGGIRQQFRAIQPMVESMLRSVKQVEGLQGPLTPEIWDEGDAVACYRSPKLAAVIFPHADSVNRLRDLCEGPNAPELVIIVNPQWEGKGNLISDFGIGPWRAAKEEVVNKFQTSFWLRQQRVYGDQIRVLYGHPGLWQIHQQPPGGVNTCIGTQEQMPTYQEIEDLLRSRPGSSINKSVGQRLRDEYEFNRKSLDNYKP